MTYSPERDYGWAIGVLTFVITFPIYFCLFYILFSGGKP